MLFSGRPIAKRSPSSTAEFGPTVCRFYVNFAVSLTPTMWIPPLKLLGMIILAPEPRYPSLSLTTNTPLFFSFPSSTPPHRLILSIAPLTPRTPESMQHHTPRPRPRPRCTALLLLSPIVFAHTYRSIFFRYASPWVFFVAALPLLQPLDRRTNYMVDAD